MDADNCVSSCPNGVCYGDCDKTHLTAIAALCNIADPYATTTTTTTIEDTTTMTTTEEETTTTGEESTTEGGEETTEDVTTDSGAMATGVAVAVVGVLAALL